MTLLRGLIDRLSLVVLIVAAGVAPGFVTQYQQQVGGRLEQVRVDLAPFQAIADQRHGGSLERLVGHHLASNDQTFRQEGSAIEAMVLKEQSLALAHQSLGTDLARQLWYLVRNAEGDVVESTWALFDPSFALNTQGMLFALIAGGAAWLALMLCLGGVRVLFRGRARVGRTGQVK